MQQMCAYEVSFSSWLSQRRRFHIPPFKTVAIGYSKFCELFTEEEWEGFNYAWVFGFLVSPPNSTSSPFSPLVWTSSFGMALHLALLLHVSKDSAGSKSSLPVSPTHLLPCTTRPPTPHWMITQSRSHWVKVYMWMPPTRLSFSIVRVFSHFPVSKLEFWELTIPAFSDNCAQFDDVRWARSFTVYPYC